MAGRKDSLEERHTKRLGKKAMSTITLMGLLTAVLLIPALDSPSAAPNRSAEPLALRNAAGIPPRPDQAIGGHEFIRGLRGVVGPDRDRAIIEQLALGNIPSFYRQLRPIQLTAKVVGDRPATAVVWVMPDYLAVGSDDDFVRIPVNFWVASEAARLYHMSLPTRKIVDAVYRQSATHLTPRPMRPGPRMRSVEYILEHHESIEAQRRGRPAGELVAGHKKDLVLSNRLRQRPGQEAIYGWHRSADDPIQSLSTVHAASYADYSHGLRLVGTTVTLNGEPQSLYKVLRDPDLAKLICYEGMIPDAEGLLLNRRAPRSSTRSERPVVTPRKP